MFRQEDLASSTYGGNLDISCIKNQIEPLTSLRSRKWAFFSPTAEAPPGSPGVPWVCLYNLEKDCEVSGWLLDLICFIFNIERVQTERAGK